MTTGDDERAGPVPPTAAGAPPTVPQTAYLPPATSSWPRVIGIIAIVLGAGGILGGLWGLAAPFVTGWMMSLVPRGAPVPSMDYLEKWNWYSAGCSVIGAVLAILLLAAGVGLTKRRRWAPQACTVWAVLKMLLVVISMVMAYFISQEALQVVGQSDPNMAAFTAQAAKVGTVFGLCFGLLWGWAMPVFLLVWLSRRTIKEEVAEWT